MTRHILSSTALAILALASGGAFGAASSTASISNITITLYDLNPTDGIASSVTFTSGNGSYTYSYEYSASPYTYSYDYNYSGTALGATSSSSTSPYASSTGSVSGSLYNGTGAVTSSSSAGAADYTYGYAYSFLSDGSTTFTLSADTLLVISATGSVTASTTASGEGDYAGAYAYLGLSGTAGAISQNNYGSFVTYAGTDYGYALASSQGGALGASFLNLTSGSASGTFYAYTETWAQSSAAALTVPEPANVALLAAGLGALGLMSRRRRKA